MITLSFPSSAELTAIEKIYTEAFPPEERRSWSSLAGDGNPELRSIVRDGELAGMISYWNFGTFVYVEHFAIDPSLRGGGTGSEVLAELRRSLGRPVVLEVERPADSNPMAARRIEFYRRNGFHVLSYDYIQPPYAPGLPSVPLLLMSTDPSIAPADVAATLHREVYGVR